MNESKFENVCANDGESAGNARKKVSAVKVLSVIAIILLCVVISLAVSLMNSSESDIEEVGEEFVAEVDNEAGNEAVAEKKKLKYPAGYEGRNPWAFYVEDIDWDISMSQLKSETSGFYEDDSERDLLLEYKGFEGLYEGKTVVRHACTPFGERSLTEILIPYDEELFNEIIEYFDAEIFQVNEETYHRNLGRAAMQISVEEEGIYIMIINLFGAGE